MPLQSHALKQNIYELYLTLESHGKSFRIIYTVSKASKLLMVCRRLADTSCAVISGVSQRCITDYTRTCPTAALKLFLNSVSNQQKNFVGCDRKEEGKSKIISIKIGPIWSWQRIREISWQKGPALKKDTKPAWRRKHSRVNHRWKV